MTRGTIESVTRWRPEDRGLSTPLDVAVGLMLVGVAVGVIAGINPVVQDTPNHGGSVLLGSPVEVHYETGSGEAMVSGTVGGLLGDAVLASATDTPRADSFRRAVTERLDKRLSRLDVPIQVVGFCRAGPGTDPVVVGETPPPDTPIEASAYPLPRSKSRPDACHPAVAVRRWSV